MRGFLSTLRQAGKNKPEVGRKHRRARNESKRFASRMAHEESRFSRSAHGRLCYNRWAKREKPPSCRAVTVSLAGAAPALLLEARSPGEEIGRRCTAQLSTTIQSLR